MTTPVLEVGGSHVTAATVDLATATVSAGPFRAGLDPQADATTLLDTFAAAAATLLPVVGTSGEPWGIAVPGPFDYTTGVGRYQGVGKFDSLNGVDVGKELAARLGLRTSQLRFLNDASAFALGAWHDGPAVGAGRLVAITLGTGVGSAFVDAGRMVESGPLVPPEGQANLLTIGGPPLEDTVSTRAMLAGYQSRTVTDGEAAPLDGLRELTRRALAQDVVALDVIEVAMAGLGTALAPWLTAFNPDTIVFGGSITGAWSLIGPPLLAALAADAPEIAASARVTVITDTERTALIGAALRTAS